VKNEYVLANVTRPGIFNFYPTEEAARADMERANTENFCGWGPYEPMTYDAYRTLEEAIYLRDPAEEITEEQWYYFLEVLPPDNLETRPGYTSFLLSEHQSGNYTSQYVAVGRGDERRYFTKTVNALLPSTWLTEDTVPPAN
jgi:hypothetical protein